MHERTSSRGRDAAEGQGSKERKELARQCANWLTAGDVARMLDITRVGVHWLVDQERLDCEWTVSGRRMFHRRDVLAFAQQRAEARLVPRKRVIVQAARHTQLRMPLDAPAAAQVLATVRPRMAKATLKQAKGSLDDRQVKARAIA